MRTWKQRMRDLLAGKTSADDAKREWRRCLKAAGYTTAGARYSLSDLPDALAGDEAARKRIRRTGELADQWRAYRNDHDCKNIMAI